MLSPDSWPVPKAPIENLRYRRWLWRRCAANRRTRDAMREACRRDVCLYINSWVWQYNPKRLGHEVEPFVTWDFQEAALRKLLDCIECHCHDSPGVHQHDMLWEKSREMGATWLALIAGDWLAGFHHDKQVLMISKSEAAVESASKDSLFWKLDFMHEHLPEWLLGPITRRKMAIGYDRTGSAIVGEASTGRAGVGGRATVMFIDEFSQIKEDYEVLHRTSDTTGCRIFNGTHMGLDTAFYELTDETTAAGSMIRKLQMHWSQHPRKRQGLYRSGVPVEWLDKTFIPPETFKAVLDGTPVGGPFPGIRSPWYDDQCGRKGSAQAVAMDLDINPQGSVSQFFDPLMIRELQATYCHPPWWEGDIAYDPETGKPLELIPGVGGPLRLWLNVDHRGKPPPAPYCGGADLARGTGATNSCLSVMNARTGEKVLEYTTPRLKPETMARVVVALGWLFQDANEAPMLLAWEMQGPGQDFAVVVLELGYRNVYYRSVELPHNLAKKVSTSPGWVPMPNNKDLLYSDYAIALKSRQCVNRSREALEECLAVRYGRDGHLAHTGEDMNDPTGARVNHGDRVIADALAWKMAKQLGSGTPAAVREEQEVPVGSLAWRRKLVQDKRREREWV